MPLVAPSPPVLSILAHFIEERAGLHYGPREFDLLADKITPRALEAGFDSLLDYYYFLRYDDANSAELDALIDTLVVNETYFFREADQLTVLVDQMFAPAIRAGKKMRVWCAACSTGEEPYTLAMLLSQRDLLAQVEIVASDISRRALERARAGQYRGRSLRSLPPGVTGRWLDEQGGEVVVRQDLRAAIDWRRINLLDTATIAGIGKFDAILCRNVLIYFDDATVLRVIESLAGALRPGGRVLVGASESLLRIGTSLTCEERGGAFFYTRSP